MPFGDPASVGAQNVLDLRASASAAFEQPQQKFDSAQDDTGRDVCGNPSYWVALDACPCIFVTETSRPTAPDSDINRCRVSEKAISLTMFASMSDIAFLIVSRCKPTGGGYSPLRHAYACHLDDPKRTITVNLPTLLFHDIFHENQKRY